MIAYYDTRLTPSLNCHTTKWELRSPFTVCYVCDVCVVCVEMCDVCGVYIVRVWGGGCVLWVGVGVCVWGARM